MTIARKYIAGQSRAYINNPIEAAYPTIIDVDDGLLGAATGKQVRLYLNEARTAYHAYDGNLNTYTVNWAKSMREWVKRGQANMVVGPIFNMTGHAMNFMTRQETIMAIPPHAILIAGRKTEPLTEGQEVVRFSQELTPTGSGINLINYWHYLVPEGIFVASHQAAQVYRYTVSRFNVMGYENLSHIDRFFDCHYNKGQSKPSNPVEEIFNG